MTQDALSQWVAIDFGTSNTAAGVLDTGSVRLIELEPGAQTLPTTLFLDFEKRTTLYGQSAIDGLIEGRDGRFMRALKSVLGAPLMREERQFLNERKRLLDVVAEFLSTIRKRSAAQTGMDIRCVLSGRPVHFRGSGENRNQRALDDLTECYRLAGFEDIRFMPEPEAAARAVQDELSKESIGLVVDIGGGTSDFSVFRASGDDIQILASHGIRIGGTDFDRALSLAHVMPLFGMGSTIRNELGSGTHTMPNAIYGNLASWEKIPFVYSPQALRSVRHMQKLANAPTELGRLANVLEHELGHDVAFSVEAGKIAANSLQAGVIDLGEVERGLRALIGPDDLTAGLAAYSEDLVGAVHQTLRLAGITPDRVANVVFVGGSSLMDIVRRPIEAELPLARSETREAFTAIVAGLTRSLPQVATAS